MTPWTLLAWLLLTTGYCITTTLIWLAGKLLNWPTWLVPLIAIGIPISAIAIIQLTRTRRHNAAATPITPSHPVLTPAMADMIPPKELAKRWNDLLPLLGITPRPVFLSLGGSDTTRSRLWRSAENGRIVRDDITGLGLVVFPDCLWIDVPAKFTSPPPPDTNGTTPSASLPGLWEELIAFLPKLPGKTRGILLFTEPPAATPSVYPEGGIELTQPALGAANTSQAWESWVCERLNYAYRKLRAEPPGLWLTTARLNEFPGGNMVITKLANADERTRLSLNKPFGEVHNSATKQTVNRLSAQRLKDSLRQQLDAHIFACDSSSETATVDREIHLIRQNLDEITAAPLSFAETLASGPASRAELSGLFLCGRWGERLAFGRTLATTTIPARTRHTQIKKRRSGLKIAGAAAFMLTAGFLAWQFLNGWRFIERLPVALLDPSSFASSDVPPPVERFARIETELTQASQTARLSRLVYTAPDRALKETERRFAATLQNWLPVGDQSTAAWITALADWSNRRSKTAPLSFTTRGGVELTRIPAAFSRKGRADVSSLLNNWQAYLPGSGADGILHVANAYDRQLFSVWETAGDTMLTRLQTAARGDPEYVFDVLSSDPGGQYLKSAANELSFSSQTTTPWVNAVRTLGRVFSSEILTGGDVTLSGLRAAARTAGELAYGAEPLKMTERLFSASDKWKNYSAVMTALEPYCADAAGLMGLSADAYDPAGASPSAPGLRQASMAWTNVLHELGALDPSFATTAGKTTLTLLSSRRHLMFAAGTIWSADDLDRSWKMMVTAPLCDKSPKEALLFLVNDKPVERFLSGSAKRFLQLTATGYIPAEAFGVPFPFDEGALGWCWEAVRDFSRLTRDYRIGLRFLPVTVDAGAKAFPRGVAFRMETEKGPITATSFNYGSGVSFDWSLLSGGDVTFSVIFDSFTLELPYPGPLSLPLFLSTASEGSIVFRSEDYPDFLSQLTRCGITQIQAHIAVHATSYPPYKSLLPPLVIVEQ